MFLERHSIIYDQNRYIDLKNRQEIFDRFETRGFEPRFKKSPGDF